MSLPAELAALRDEATATSCESWAIRKRWPIARGIDRAGPCPVCGGNDRFSIHTKKNTWHCRRCDQGDAGVISLVMWSEGVDFVNACEIVTGRSASAPVDEKRAVEIAAKRAAEDKRRQDQAERYRQEARRQGWAIFCAAYPLRDRAGPVWHYLVQRGIDLGAAERQGFDLSILKLREHPQLPYLDKVEGRWTEIHAGPAMVAAVQMPDDRFGAVHQTWLDPAQPKGKLVLPAGEDGQERPSKKVRGTKKGGAIRIYTPPGASRIVMGEGIETTLTALAFNFEPETAYWTGVDVGNMAGRALRDGEGRQIHDEPDLEDLECFVPPGWARELVFLCDSDEPEKRTVEKIIRGLKRARALRPELETSYVPPIGAGLDLNDLVMVSR